MLDTLITSQTRIKLLLKFFLNSRSSAYLRSLESDFGESTNAIRLELNRFEKAGLLISEIDGNRKVFRANVDHPLFSDINSILMKQIGIDQIVERVIKRLGEIKKVFVTGAFAQGNDSEFIDLVFVSDLIDASYLDNLVEKAEKVIRRRIRYKVLTSGEFRSADRLTYEKSLLIWDGESNEKG